MKHEESSFTGLRDTEIYYQSWLSQEISAVLIIVHGFGEHSGRYSNVVNALQKDNIAIYALDHRGHGRSGGMENYVDRFTDYLEDLSTFESIVFEKHPDHPKFILGHSMGSLIVTHFMASNQNQDEYSSMILSGTGSDFGPGINRFTIFLARFLSLILPKMKIPSNLDPTFISRDQTVVDAYINDPLVHYEKITTRLGSEMMKRTQNMLEAAGKIKIPTLIQIGSEDDAFAPDSREPLLEEIDSDTKELKIYKDFRHEVYNEMDNEVVFKDLRDWLKQFY